MTQQRATCCAPPVGSVARVDHTCHQQLRVRTCSMFVGVCAHVCGSGSPGPDGPSSLVPVPGLRPAAVTSGDRLAPVTVLGAVWWGGDLGGSVSLVLYVSPPPLSLTLGLSEPSPLPSSGPASAAAARRTGPSGRSAQSGLCWQVPCSS